jgi:serine/threonine-protein kinase
MTTALLRDLEVGEPLRGADGASRVYPARQRSDGREVALHVLESPSPEHDRESREQLEILTRLRDRNLLEVIGTGTWQGKTVCITEWPGGEDLETQLRKGHRFTTEEILHIAERAARALHAAARVSVVHGRLCPANLYLAADGSVKLAGFGSGAATPAPARELPVERLVYLSPEQAAGEAPDARSDLYSLGCVLYELSCRRKPFEGYDSSTSLLYQIAHVQPASPRQLGASIPRELDRLVLSCLEKSSSERPQTPLDFLEQVRQVRDSLSSARIAAVPAEEDSGDFDIHEDQPVGEGGMGTLFRGRQRSLNREVVIKLMREAFGNRADFVQRFRREAELLAQVDCANVVQIYGTGIWRGQFFYAMELVPGEDLAARQRRGHPFTPDEILNVAEGVGNALKAAWKYKIIHRDIKPSNVLMTPEGVVKVADFGLAKSLRIPGDSKVLAGTAEYVSPEQGLGQPMDIRSDLYSLGVVLYELASGRHPFRGAQSSVAMIFNHVHTEPPSLTDIGSTLPPAHQALIHRCLRKRPEERFQTPDEFLQAVRQARRQASVALPRAPRPRRRMLGLSIAAALCFGAAVGGGVALARRAPPVDPPAEARDFDLALALGQVEQALEIAERSFPPDSPRLAAARQRRADRALREAMRAVTERLRARDWNGALEGIEALRRSAPPERGAELDALAAYARDFLAARGHEERGEWEAALAAYRRLAGLCAADQDHLRERIAAVEARLRGR